MTTSLYDVLGAYCDVLQRKKKKIVRLARENLMGSNLASRGNAYNTALRNAWRAGYHRAESSGALEPCPYTRDDLIDAYEKGFEWFVQMQQAVATKR